MVKATKKSVTSLNTSEIDSVFSSMFNKVEKLKMITSKLGNSVQVKNAIAIQVIEIPYGLVFYFVIPGDSKPSDVLLNKYSKFDFSNVIFKEEFEAAIRQGASVMTFLSSKFNPLITLN